MEEEKKKVVESETEEVDLKVSKDEGFEAQENNVDNKIGSEIITNINEREMEKGNEKYNASDLDVLEGLQAVRLRPGMYIGTTSSVGLHHLIWEIVDNGIDEALAGFCDEINVSINNDNTITVKDNGRGIPVDIVAKTGRSGVETVYTKLHAGGKFGQGGGYKVSGGLHGVGASVVNALSSWLDVRVFKDGGEYFLRFENGGHAVGHLTRVGDTTRHGTEVTFKPDHTIFDDVIFDYDLIRDRVKTMAYLNRGVLISVEDKRNEKDPKKEVFKYDGGIKEFVEYLNTHKEPINNPIVYCEALEGVDIGGGKVMNIYAEVAMQYNTSYSSNVYSFCNNINTHEGGTHEEGFRLAINRVMNDYARNNKFLKENEENLSTDDIREGLTAIISVKHPDPQYEGQ